MLEPNQISVLSIAWAASRVVTDAVDAGRLSSTEAAVILDLVWHEKLPKEFRERPADGGYSRQEKF